MSESKTRVYCFDSSIFITINRINNIFPVPDIWNELDTLFKNGRLISHIYVYNEFQPGSQKSDFLGKWVKERKKYFIHESETQIKFVRQILGRFNRLIDPNKERNQADPWIIALAMEKNKENSLFGSNKDYTVVSRENTRSSVKIPAVCKAFNVPHLTMEQFLGENGWRLGFIKD